MTIFDERYHPNKVNFVDKNNVFIGYDLEQNCCEHSGWFLSDKIHSEIHKNNEEYIKNLGLDKYVFDAEFFKKSVCDETHLAIFKLKYKSKELYLHLFNVHNGYYSHGFQVFVGGQKTKEEYL